MSVDRAAQPRPRLADQLATARVARRFYLDGASKVEIAEELGMSRFKVARLLEAARESGLVRIEIGNPGAIDLDLSDRLQQAFDLTYAVVLDVPDDDETSVRQHLGRAAADLLTEIVTVDDVLGLAWARSVSATVTALTELPPISVVQLTGALSRQADDSSIDIVREVARVANGRAHFFFAPFVVADAGTARALRRQADVAGAFAQIGSVTKAVAGIGRWGPGQSTLYEAATEHDRRRLERQGVCADIGGVFITSDGTPVHTPLNDLLIGISAEQLAAIPEVIGIPYGTAKAPAVLAALRSRLVTGLVTHASLARLLLDAVPRQPDGADGDPP